MVWMYEWINLEQPLSCEHDLYALEDGVCQECIAEGVADQLTAEVAYLREHTEASSDDITAYLLNRMLTMLEQRGYVI